MLYIYIDRQSHQVTETQAELQERINVRTKWANWQCYTSHALLKTLANSDFMHIMQYVHFSVPRSAGYTITFRLIETSGVFNMLVKPTNV